MPTSVVVIVVVVEDCDEFLYCLDTNIIDSESKESPIFVWYKANVRSAQRAKSFAQLFLNRSIDAIEDEESLK